MSEDGRHMQLQEMMTAFWQSQFSEIEEGFSDFKTHAFPLVFFGSLYQLGSNQACNED